MNIPQDNLAYPVLVRAAKSQGTGFFLNAPDGTYLITASHVLFKKDGELMSDEIELVAPAADLKEETKLHVSINAKTLFSQKKIFTPPGVDIAGFKIFTISDLTADDKRTSQAIPEMKILEKSSSGYMGVNHKSIKFFEEVVIGNDVVIFGYPSAIGMASQPQIDYSRALLRKGIVAGKNNSKKTLIIDCPSYPGNSGGPVVQVDQISFNTWKFDVIGVVTEFVPYYSEQEIKKGVEVKKLEIFTNTGYSVVVPMDEVYRMIGLKRDG